MFPAFGFLVLARTVVLCFTFVPLGSTVPFVVAARSRSVTARRIYYFNGGSSCCCCWWRSSLKTNAARVAKIQVNPCFANVFFGGQTQFFFHFRSSSNIGKDTFTFATSATSAASAMGMGMPIHAGVHIGHGKIIVLVVVGIKRVETTPIWKHWMTVVVVVVVVVVSSATHQSQG